MGLEKTGRIARLAIEPQDPAGWLLSSSSAEWPHAVARPSPKMPCELQRVRQVGHYSAFVQSAKAGWLRSV